VDGEDDLTWILVVSVESANHLHRIFYFVVTGSLDDATLDALFKFSLGSACKYAGPQREKDNELKHQSTICDSSSSGNTIADMGRRPQKPNGKKIHDLKNQQANKPGNPTRDPTDKLQAESQEGNIANKTYTGHNAERWPEIRFSLIESWTASPKDRVSATKVVEQTEDATNDRYDSDNPQTPRSSPRRR
jgi:hypothetical protein